MSNAVIPRTESLLPSQADWQTIMQMADVFFASHLLPSHIKSVQAAALIMQKGVELRIPPTVALSKINVINGKPACDSELMLGLVYRDHGDDAVMFEKSDSTICTVSYKRRSWTERKYHSFTIDEAKAAALSSQVWKSYPSAMLRARCVSAMARMGFPDTIGGLYTFEEMGATVTIENGEQVVIDVQPVPESKKTSKEQQSAPAAPRGVEQPKTDPLTACREQVKGLAIELGREAPSTIGKLSDLAVWIGLDPITSVAQITIELLAEMVKRLEQLKAKRDQKAAEQSAPEPVEAEFTDPDSDLETIPFIEPDPSKAVQVAERFTNMFRGASTEAQLSMYHRNMMLAASRGELTELQADDLATLATDIAQERGWQLQKAVAV